jgi:uncharacterized protein YdaU (DUF1376 family)
MSYTHWYARYPGDYAKDTMGLSMVEHGAYTLLLDYYYSENKGISANALHLHRVCRAFAEEEKIAVEKIVKIYFKEIDGFLYNARADKELEKKNNISKKRSNSAKIKNKKYSASAPASAPASALQVHTQPQPQPQLQLQPQRKNLHEEKEPISKVDTCGHTGAGVDAGIGAGVSSNAAMKEKNDRKQPNQFKPREMVITSDYSVSATKVANRCVTIARKESLVAKNE